MRKLIVLGLLVFIFGCVKPPMLEIVEKIESFETGYLIPLEGNLKDGQKQFASIDYLESKKIATKQVSITQRPKKIGRWNWQIIWIPTAELVRVNRTPVTREWTEELNRGTSNKNEAIDVESKDSIGFSVGVNLTALVEEQNTSTFLYYHPGKSLVKDIDENVRGFVTSILSREFGSRNLKECKEDKKEIQTTLEKEVKSFYAKLGITITNIGLVGGLHYEDTEIQKSINDAYVAEMSIKTAEQDKEAQKFTNEKLISIAVAERKAAEEFAKAKEAMIEKTNLEIKMKQAEAMLIAAQKWQGNMPASILPQGSNLLFGLDE